MFGFGKGDRSKQPQKRDKAEERHIERKEREAVAGYFESAKKQSDDRAKRG